MPAPDLEAAVRHSEIGLLQLMSLALLERGEPMTYAGLAARLEAAGAEAPSKDMVLSCKRAWHGRPPIVREPDGRLALDLDSSWLDHILFKAGLRGSRIKLSRHGPPDPEVPDDDVPLSAEELDAAFKDQDRPSFSKLREVAAVLEVAGRPMSIAAVNDWMCPISPRRKPLTEDTVRRWRSGLVTVDRRGRLVLDPDHPDVPAMRSAVRALAHPVLRAVAQEKRSAAAWEELERKRLEDDRRLEAEAAGLRRAVVRAVPSPSDPRALALLDTGERRIRTFVGQDVRAFPAEVQAFDLLAGLHVRDTLHALGLDPNRWRLKDLKPPQKTRRLNRAGRLLQITPELIISGTTGLSRPLGDPARVARYLAEGAEGKLARRLASDVKALHALYRYGVLHGAVRLRWGFLDEHLPVDWTVPGDLRLYPLLDRARREGSSVDLVLGTAPGWSEPWSRAHRFEVVDVGYHGIKVREGGEVFSIDRDEIQAARLAPAR